MEPNLWNSLEALSVGAALLVEWQKEIGPDFERSRPFIEPTHQQSDSYPCTQPQPCACRHRVIFDSPDDISAVCDCEEPGCEPILLGAADLIVYALNGKALAAAIRQAFHFVEINSAGFEGVPSYLVGGWGIRHSRVFFNVPISESGLLKEIDLLCATFSDPFILLTPTSQFCTPMVERALRRQGCAQMALGGVLKVAAPGVLELVPSAKAAVDAFFDDFGKQVAQGKPLELAIGRVEAKLDAIAKNRRKARTDTENVSEDVARQALALVEKLDTETRLKKPSLATVFRLYCVNEMSATQIAKHCGCSKTAVIERLQILSQCIGRPVGTLRRHSEQFQRIEDEMSDSRARRIDRQKIADGGPDESDDS